MSTSQRDVAEMLSKEYIQCREWLLGLSISCPKNHEHCSLTVTDPLSLSVADAVKLIQLLRNTMDTVHEISKVLQYSPKRSQCDISPDTTGFRVLRPTRWTVRSKTFRSILEDYVSFLQTWESMLESRLDSDARAHVHGFNSQMRTFDFSGLNLLYNLLRHTDNLSTCASFRAW